MQNLAKNGLTIAASESHRVDPRDSGARHPERSSRHPERSEGTSVKRAARFFAVLRMTNFAATLTRNAA
jgi:hypothetical protein